MTTIVERDSSTSAVLLIFVVLLLVGGGFGLAYMNGVFGEKTTVIENNKTVENKTVVLPAPAAPVAPAGAPNPERHEQAPVR